MQENRNVINYQIKTEEFEWLNIVSEAQKQGGVGFEGRLGLSFVP